MNGEETVTVIEDAARKVLALASEHEAIQRHAAALGYDGRAFTDFCKAYARAHHSDATPTRVGVLVMMGVQMERERAARS